MKKLFIPQFLEKTPFKTVLILSIIQVLLFLAFAQFNGNELIPKPTGVFSAMVNKITGKGFADNFISTLWLVIKSMVIAVTVSLFVVYMSLIPAFKGIAIFISKLRFLTFTGLIFVFTILISNGSNIKVSLLLFGIIPYFVTTLLSYIYDPNDKSFIQEYKLCYTLKFSKWQTLYEVVIKGRLHLVVEVIKQNFAIAWMMITSVEGICMSEGGLGTMMIKSNKYVKIDEVFGVLLIILLLGILFDYMFDLIKVWSFPYTDTKRNSKLLINSLFKSKS